MIVKPRVEAEVHLTSINRAAIEVAKLHYLEQILELISNVFNVYLQAYSN